MLEQASSPSAVRLQPRVRTLVRDLHAQTNGALALVSGRAIADVGAMFGALVARHTGLQLEDIRCPHSCGPTLVFIGDDVTDEDGCMRVNPLGGRSSRVGRGRSGARGRLGDTNAVIGWLARALAPVETW